MIVFVYRAQLLFEQRDCAFGCKSQVLGACENPPALRFQGLLVVICVFGQHNARREASPPRPRGHTWMLWLMCPGGNLFS